MFPQLQRENATFCLNGKWNIHHVLKCISTVWASNNCKNAWNMIFLSFIKMFSYFIFLALVWHLKSFHRKSIFWMVGKYKQADLWEISNFAELWCMKCGGSSARQVIKFATDWAATVTAMYCNAILDKYILQFETNTFCHWLSSSYLLQCSSRQIHFTIWDTYISPLTEQQIPTAM